MCQVSNLIFSCMGNLHIHLPRIHIGLKEFMKVQALWPRYRPDALFHPSDILLTTVCARVVHTIILGSSICKHCQYFAGRQEGLNSLGAQVDGEHDPPQQTDCMNGFIHTVCSLPASLTSRLKELPWPPSYCLLEQVSRLAFSAVLLTPAEVCTSLHFSLAVKWLGTILSARVEATLCEGVLNWREKVKILKVLHCTSLN